MWPAVFMLHFSHVGNVSHARYIVSHNHAISTGPHNNAWKMYVLPLLGAIVFISFCCHEVID